MSAPRRSRREFVLAAAGLGGGLVFVSLRPWRTLVQVEAPGTPALRLSRLIEHRRSARAVGLEYLRDAPSGTTAAALAHLVGAGVPGGLAGRHAATDHKLRELLAARIRQDFDQERVVAVDGWVASLTEARLCAIVALVGV